MRACIAYSSWRSLAAAALPHLVCLQVTLLIIAAAGHAPLAAAVAPVPAAGHVPCDIGGHWSSLPRKAVGGAVEHIEFWQQPGASGLGVAKCQFI